MSARRRIGVAVGLGLGLAAGCGPKVGPNGVSAGDAILLVHSNVSDASVWVDGRYIAPIGRLHGGVAVGPGHHRLEVRHDDYFSAYLEVDAKAAERRAIELPLAPILP